MKKVLGLIMCVSLSLGFFSCGDSDDGGSESSGVKTISADVEAKTSEKGASVTQTGTLDLSKNPLTDEGIAAIKENPEKYFRQSRVDASRSVISASGADDAGLDDFKVSITEITKIKIVFEITATAPSADCSIMISAVIPPEATEKKKSFVQLVTQVNVGSGAGESSIESIEGFSIPSADEVKGLVLKETESDGDIYYFEFTEKDNKVIVNQYKAYSYSWSDGDSIDSDPRHTFTYNIKTGELKEFSEEKGDYQDAINAAMNVIGETPRLAKVGDNFYIYSMKLERSSGKDLDSTFSSTTKIDESVKAEINGKNVTIANLSGNYDVSITTTSKGAFTGAVAYKSKISYSSEFKKAMTSSMGLDEAMKDMPEEYKKLYEKEMAEAMKELEKSMGSKYQDVSSSGNSDVTGVYVNNKGVLTMNGKATRNCTEPDYDYKTGKMEMKTVSEVKEFDKCKAFYDGKNLYFAEECTKVAALPENRY